MFDLFLLLKFLFLMTYMSQFVSYFLLFNIPVLRAVWFLSSLVMT